MSATLGFLKGEGVLDGATIGESGFANGAERVMCLCAPCVCARAEGSVGFLGREGHNGNTWEGGSE